jgi:tetratricopeptide (TPR) repeat protein
VYDTSTPESLLNALILAVPVAVLALLLVLALRRGRSRGTAVEEEKPKAAEVTQSPQVPEPAIPAESKVDPHEALSLMPGQDTSAAVLQSRITTAEARRDTAGLAALYLALGRLEREAGRDGRALKALRSAAGLGALHGPKKVHAEARLELADAAYRAGDLTTACEHWQLARAALLDDGQRDASALIDKHMRDNGCPTDWVLTDF